jgi:hypothetical protein
MNQTSNSQREKNTDSLGCCRRLLATSCLLVTLLFGFSAAASCLSSPSGLTNFWTGDGNANDLVGTNNGTLSNGTTFVAGQVGSAFSFDGVNDTVQIGGSPIPVPWTAEFWVKRQASPQDSAVLIGDTNTALKLEQYQNTKQVGFTKWGIADYYFNYVAPTNTWIHLAFVGTASNIKLYVNGTAQDTNANTMSLPRRQLGNDIPGRFNKPLKGLLDEVSLYNRALSAAEIASIFNAGAEGKCRTVCVPGFPDNFDCRQTLTGSNLTWVSSNVGATYELYEPQHFPVTTSNSIWYTWTAPSGGGLVFKSQGPFFNFKPIVAVYTGTSLSNLIKLTSNSGAGNGAGGEPIARAVLSVVQGQNYQIAVDGDVGPQLTNTLTLLPPPPNDLFSNSIPIGGIFHSNAGSFLGASRELGESSHSAASLGQTLWWNWIAPTNAPNPVSVRLLTDAVSFPPGLGVYTGNVVSNLSAITLNKKTNGMTTDAVFDAIPGTTYRIALAGTASDSESASPLIGDFHFRLNTRALALTITNLTTTTNFDGAVPFQANALIQNLGNATSGPLRVSVSAISGLSTTRALTNPPVSTVSNLYTTNLTAALSIGQSLLVHISGTAPAPNSSDQTAPIAYGVYAELQEQPVTNKWFTVDQTLVTYDNWPGVGQIFGPGGGVIRLDPGYGGASTFVSNVVISGATTIPEGRSTNYFGKATFVDGTTQNFTNTVWLTSLFAIATNGVFTTGSVTSNTPVSLGAIYSFAGITSYAFTNVTVANLPPPTITNTFAFGNAGFVFTLVGVPGRSNVIEATTNLSAPVLWLPLITNAPANGSFTYTNFSRTNFPVRFFRAREK